MTHCTVEQAIQELRAGKFIILVDDEDRENEGDLVIPAELATPEAINYMAQYARGLVCVPMTGERLDQLDIPLMNSQNPDAHGTAFTVSVDYIPGTSTGISAHDRSATVRAMIDPAVEAQDFSRPGHMFPLRYRPGGVLSRTGHTEASVDLCRLAGYYPAAVICEILNEDGTMARRPDLERFAKEHQLKILTIADLVNYRKYIEYRVEKVSEARLPTDHGEFTAIGYRSQQDTAEHLALTLGKWDADHPVLVRIHSECLTGDVLGSQRCDCGEQLSESMALIAQLGQGVLLYMRQEGRGIGLHNKIKAYGLQDRGLDTVEANQYLGFPPDQREYTVCAQILNDLGINRVRLLTNNPSKVSGLGINGIEVVERVPLEIASNAANFGYLETKRIRMGHLIRVQKPQNLNKDRAVALTA